jgi:tRNA pseudouridine55 synthase
MYSAIKVNGKKLYELARDGIEIERKPREVRIISINELKIDYPYISMEVECSKGTYIRTLCHDIGIKLGTYGCMTSLERVKSGAFKIDEAYKLSQVEEMVKNGKIDDIIIPTDKAFKNLKSIIIDEEQNKLLYNGNPIPADKIKMSGELKDKPSENEKYRVYDYKNDFIGVYKVKENFLKPEKLFL